MAKRCPVTAEVAGSNPVGPAISEPMLYWLAGILEGEGSFMKGVPSCPNAPRIGIQMTDRDVLEKVAAFFEVSVCRAGVTRQKKNPHWKPAFIVQIHGVRAIWWMRQVYPLMSARRRMQIDSAIASYNPNRLDEENEQRRKIHILDLPEIRRRYKSGESLRKIAASIGVHHETVRKRLLSGHPKMLSYVA